MNKHQLARAERVRQILRDCVNAAIARQKAIEILNRELSMADEPPPLKAASQGK